MIAMLLAQAAGNEVQLTTVGAVIMIGSVVLVCGLNIFCLRRVLRSEPPTDEHN